MNTSAAIRTSAYRRPPRDAGALNLDCNEGALPSRTLLETLAGCDPELLRRYPDVSALETSLAERLGVAPESVIVTAGADEAIDRAFRAYLQPGRALLLPDPTFEMFDRFASLAGAEIVRVPWPREPFPRSGFLARLDARTAVIAVVSPNNPTGAVASAEDVRALAEAAPHALVLVDLAYVEYADDDLTAGVLDSPNLLILRTLSKAWGLAGCRIGYAVGQPQVVAAMRAAGGPYSVAAPSVSIALAQLASAEATVRDHVARVRWERTALTERLATLGLEPSPSQANFVLVDCGDAAPFVAAALAALGVIVRDFPDRPGLTSALRITLPGDAVAFDRLTAALETTLSPEAVLLDMDGVLADVRESQRAAIAATAASFGVPVTARDVAAAMRAGNAANDWVVTQRLIATGGRERPLQEVAARYQSLYLGLRERERLIPTRSLLERLSARRPLAIVTGRPRDEAEWFLAKAGIAGLITALVAMEDAPGKPDAAPVRLALDRLGVRRAWMVGDTTDDVRAAAEAGVLPVAVVAPGDDPVTTAGALYAAGAVCVLTGLVDLLERLP